jgi:lipopolysaccharide biosynthesis glycosyltransferase
VIQSLQEFWSHPVAPCGITARTDNVLYLNTVGLPGNTSWHDTYGYSFNAGVLLLSLETLRQSKFEETIVQHWAVALGFNDQVVLNMACNGTQGILNETMNMLMVPDFAKSRNPDKNWVTTLYYPPPQEWVIAHFVSSKKPWSKTKRKELPNFIRVWKDHKLSLADALAR